MNLYSAVSKSPHRSGTCGPNYLQRLLRLDSPGTQTILSGPESKAMTHYLRSQHDVIIVGVGTAVADNPALNCRIEGVGLKGQPRPLIIDPSGRWEVESEKGLAECVRLAEEGVGKGPWVFTSLAAPKRNQKWSQALDKVGGAYISIPSSDIDGKKDLDWSKILEKLAQLGMSSVMIEGGGSVINTLLQEKYLHLIDSVMITIAPVWLGQGGVVISPPRRADASGQAIPAARLHQTKWQQFGDDVVMCGRIKQ
ncbi:dihydrofolate reductase [Tothia fuscella]|uniref:2,5-diamino-6-ribosylamino-4(3H)-pyrimidinone 5'-phosphate reductase n=1 Tax=Tothia fuscella TaxID=1048955 RepID=A0A9P4P224_9PEZI|nr:dihydrofolate reductase [Tothia fuscella]